MEKKNLFFAELSATEKLEIRSNKALFPFLGSLVSASLLEAHQNLKTLAVTETSLERFVNSLPIDLTATLLRKKSKVTATAWIL